MKTDVLVIGAGPVGLACALDLAWRGIDCVLIDRGDGQVRLSKMGLVSVRSMEFCRRWGIADRVRACGFPEDYPLNQVFCTSLAGHHVGTIAYPGMRDEPVPPESPERRQRCPQLWFDPLLLEAVRGHDRHVTLRRGCELETIAQDADSIRACVRDLATGDEHEIEAAYAIGCDGAGSLVRQASGIDFEGEVLSYSTGIYFRSPGLVHRHDKGPAERYQFIGPEGTWGHLTVVDGDAYWRLTITGSRERVEADDFDARAVLQRALGDAAIPFEIDAVMPWRRSRLVASRFRSGRIFIAGDAAHVTAPNGGYGMNTGLADAVDLGWKLDAVLAGWGGPDLLDSYDIERRPVAWRAVDAAAVNFGRVSARRETADVLDDGPAGERCRQALGAALGNDTRSLWETLGMSLGYRYEGSPLIVPDGSPATADDPIRYEPTARPGHRAPHAWVAPGQSTIDAYGRGFVLLRLGDAAPAVDAVAQAARRRGMPLVITTHADPALRALHGADLVLVRPDGHVAWRGDQVPADALALVDRVRGG
jgi:2-polyprenyl-6-methoxyphenol hydroxylase-like FAD-dependent oxidoreductase